MKSPRGKATLPDQVPAAYLQTQPAKPATGERTSCRAVRTQPNFGNALRAIKHGHAPWSPQMGVAVEQGLLPVRTVRRRLGRNQRTSRSKGRAYGSWLCTRRVRGRTLCMEARWPLLLRMSRTFLVAASVHGIQQQTYGGLEKDCTALLYSERCHDLAFRQPSCAWLRSVPLCHEL